MMMELNLKSVIIAYEIGEGSQHSVPIFRQVIKCVASQRIDSATCNENVTEVKCLTCST